MDLNKNLIAQYNNVEYLVHPAFDPAIDPKSQAEIAESKPNCNYISYYRGANDKIDLRLAQPVDHIHLILDSEDNTINNVKDIYLNSENLKNTFVHADQPSKAVLHINHNTCIIDENRFKIIPDDARYLADVDTFLATLKTEDNQPIFSKITFENNSYKLGAAIKEICDKNSIKSYGMSTDETGHKGYFTASNAHNSTKILKNKPLSKLNINTGKTTKINSIVEK